MRPLAADKSTISESWLEFKPVAKLRIIDSASLTDNIKLISR